ncbi:MAG TPA: response regulator transcription factor [Solirubrobacteraceae bacterium]|nr:response regulator transcription factor [Solirubrobacteraceae bacterium]
MGGGIPEVLIADDQLAVRRGTELTLREAGFRVAGVAATLAEAAGLLRRRRYDVALVDTLLQDAPTAPMLGELLSDRPDAPVIVFAGRDRAALGAVAGLGAPGLVLKSSPPPTLMQALRTVIGGRRFVDPLAAARVPESARRTARDGAALLSPREREILVMLAEGFSGAEIATRLFLSSETVRTHVRNAVQKLGCRTRTQAVALLIRQSEGPLWSPSLG